jgi:superfamily I DNA and/or RNA helicase
VAGGAASVAVITPYAAQAREIQRQLAAHRVTASRVECATIHRFQGRECDVVLIDLVDAAPMRPGLLLCGGPRSDSAQLLNVSLSRARGKLILVADVGYFADHAPGSAVTAILGEAIRTGARVDPARPLR